MDWVAGLDGWTGLLDLICSYHMTSIQSDVINYYKLHFIFPLHVYMSAQCSSYMDGCVPRVHGVHTADYSKYAKEDQKH